MAENRIAAQARVAPDAGHLLCARCNRGILAHVTFDLTPRDVEAYLGSTDPDAYFLFRVGAAFRAPIGWSHGPDGVWTICNNSKRRRQRRRQHQKMQLTVPETRRAKTSGHICPTCGGFRPISVCTCARAEYDEEEGSRLKYRSGAMEDQGFMLPVPCAIRCDVCGQVQDISVGLLETTRPPMAEHGEDGWLYWCSTLPPGKTKLRNRTMYNDIVWEIATAKAHRVQAQFIDWQRNLPRGVVRTWAAYWAEHYPPPAERPQSPVLRRLNDDMFAVWQDGASHVHVVSEAHPPALTRRIDPYSPQMAALPEEALLLRIEVPSIHEEIVVTPR